MFVRGCCILRLPPEIVEVLITFLEDPVPFISSHPYFYKVSQSSIVRTNWLLNHNHHSPDLALQKATNYKFFSPTCFWYLDRLKRKSKLNLLSQKCRKAKSPMLSFANPIPMQLLRIAKGESAHRRRRKEELISLLLDSGAPSTLPDNYPLISAVCNGFTHIAKRLLSTTPDVNFKDGILIVLSTKNGDVEMTKLLLEHRVKPTSKALRNCVARKDWELADLLMTFGAVPDFKTCRSLSSR
jgi:hypothetical protein